MTEKLKNLSLYLPLCELKPPRKNTPIIIQPIPPLPQIANLPDDILLTIGALTKNEQKSSSILQSFFPQCSCACNAISKQTLNQIGRQPDLQKQKTMHLNDTIKKNRFRQIYKLQTNADLSIDKNNTVFDQKYCNFGHGNQQQWIKIIRNSKINK